MRQSLLFGGLEAVAYNANRRNGDLSLYEFGNCYHTTSKEQEENPLKSYSEEEHLALFISGNKEQENWAIPQAGSNFFQLKAYVEKLLLKLGLKPETLKLEDSSDDLFSEGLIYSTTNGRKLVEFGIVSQKNPKRV